jgi:hypothetical protein
MTASLPPRTSGIPDEGPAQIAAASGVLQELQRGFGDGEPVPDTEPYRAVAGPSRTTA